MDVHFPAPSAPTMESLSYDAEVTPQAILTDRLRLTPATEATLRLELDDITGFAALLGVSLPQDWPPGEYDRDAIQFFLKKSIEGGPEAAGWFGWYAILEGSGPAALVGCGGYLGPPDATGRVEIGYSICERWKGQGLAKELVRALVDHAWKRGAGKIAARTSEANPASISVLRSCGFRETTGSEPGLVRFEIVPSS